MDKPIRKAVRAYLIKDEKIICIKYHDDHPARGFYDLPGGKIEDGETLEQTVRREIKEEADISHVGKILHRGRMIAEYPNRIYDFEIFLINDFALEYAETKENFTEFLPINELVTKNTLPCIEVLKDSYYPDLLDLSKTMFIHILVDDEQNVSIKKYEIN